MNMHLRKNLIYMKPCMYVTLYFSHSFISVIVNTVSCMCGKIVEFSMIMTWMSNMKFSHIFFIESFDFIALKQTFNALWFDIQVLSGCACMWFVTTVANECNFKCFAIVILFDLFGNYCIIFMSDMLLNECFQCCKILMKIFSWERW